MRKHTTITVRGDEEFVRACKAAAARRGIKIGDFVRNALDAIYPNELSDAQIYVAMPDRQIEQKDDQLIEQMA